MNIFVFLDLWMISSFDPYSYMEHMESDSWTESVIYQYKGVSNINLTHFNNTTDHNESLHINPNPVNQHVLPPYPNLMVRIHLSVYQF